MICLPRYVMHDNIISQIWTSNVFLSLLGSSCLFFNYSCRFLSLLVSLFFWLLLSFLVSSLSLLVFLDCSCRFLSIHCLFSPLLVFFGLFLSPLVTSYLFSSLPVCFNSSRILLILAQMGPTTTPHQVFRHSPLHSHSYIAIVSIFPSCNGS